MCVAEAGVGGCTFNASSASGKIESGISDQSLGLHKLRAVGLATSKRIVVTSCKII